MEKDLIAGAAGVIKELAVGEYATLNSRLARGGALQARRLSTGAVQLYWRFSLAGKTSREPIGVFDPGAPPKKLEPTSRGYGIAAALERCRELAAVHVSRADTGGLEAVKAEQRKAFKVQQVVEAEKADLTLKKLFDTYLDYLKANERSSHVDAAQIFRKHVEEAWPAVAATPAVDVTPDDLLDVLRGLIEAGKGRTSNKLRAYVRAAYQCALDVKTTASIPVAFKRFAVVFNPAAQTKRSARFDRADKRPFSKEDLQTYWGLIRDVKGDEAAMVRLHLLTGGQRVEQLVRLRTAEVHQDVLTIYDLKGRPGQGPRAHPIPVIKEARQALDSLKIKGTYALSTTGGEKPISVRTLAGWANDIVGEKVTGFLRRPDQGDRALRQHAELSRQVLVHRRG